jgi:transposase
MPLCSKIKVEMPRSGVVIRRSGPYHTVFHRVKSYRNANGVPTSDRVVIGKLDAATGMLIPNDNYWLHYSDPEAQIVITPSYSSNRSVGGAYLFHRISSQLGLTEILDECLGKKRSASARTAALHMIARGNVFENVLDYCEGYTLSEPPLTSQSASELFASITFDERMEFFRRWLACQPMGPFLAYDSTSFSTYAKGILKSEHGFNKDGERLPQINFGCYHSQETGLPIFYVIYPGSIVDKSHLPYMMAYNSDLGIKNVGFVMDSGYCSTANAKFMVKEGLDFIMGVDITHKTTRVAVKAFRGKLTSLRNKAATGVYAKSMRGCFYGVSANMHVYYEPSLEDAHMMELDRLVEKKEETLAQLGQLTRKEARKYRRHFVIELAKDGSFTYSRDYDKIEAMSSYFGYFCLLTNTSLDSAAALEVYRRKDVIEKGFDDIKNHIDMRRMRTHNEDTTEGKMFCAFIALIVTSHIGVKLRDYLKKKSWSKDHVMAEMEKIRIIVSPSGNRLSDPLTKKQRLIIEPFGLDAEDLENYVKDGST